MPADIVNAHRQLLLDDLSILVGLGGRCWTLNLPSAVGNVLPVLPALVCSEVSGRHEHHLGGLAGFRHTRARVRVYAEDPHDAEVWRREVARVTCAGSGRGFWGDDLVVVSGAVVAAEGDGVEPPDDGDGASGWRPFKFVDFDIAYQG